MTDHPLKIVKFPNPRLRTHSQFVQNINKEMKILAQKMLEFMYEENGVGLAAIQVNQAIRLFVADTRSKNSQRYKQSNMGDLEKDIVQPLIFFNPEIIEKEGEVIFQEGCLSFPSYFADVKRSKTVKVKAFDQKGRKFSIQTDGLLSICIQHEIDHLDGKLFIDHLSPAKAKQLVDQINKHGYPEIKKEK